MKRIRIITLIFVFTLPALFQGCTNLDEEVFDELPVEEFGQSEAQINALIAPIYRTLKGVFPANYFLLSECSSDMAITPTRRGGDWWDGGQFKELRLHTWSPNTALVRDAYNSATESISSCNRIYAMINENETIENKDQILAEIRAVRAFWYYMLLDYYGNVPIVNDFNDTSLPSTSSRAEVYEFIMNELNEIKDVLGMM